MPDWKINLLYDGACPLCLREVNFLQKKDNGRGLVAFTDIAADDYDPAAHGNVSFEAAMARIHAILPDGTAIQNIEVFRRVYTILGIGWMYVPTQWPILGPIVDKLYDIWADWRLQLTGRPDLATIIAQRNQRCQPEEACRL